MPNRRKTTAEKQPGMPVTPAEANRLFSAWKSLPSLVLAVSGGPDSVALMWLVARWRARLATGPRIIAVTIDHGLRTGSAAEARAVHALAKTLGVEHKILRWKGDKPATGIPAVARDMRYRLLARAGRGSKAFHIATAHTQDDQAETLMMRMARGSGLAGLAAMRSEMIREDGVTILRPFLELPKVRLIATLRRAGVEFADDPTNRDTKFTRPRWRALMPALAEEGLNAHGLARLAARLGRANLALEMITDITERSVARIDSQTGASEIDIRTYQTLPEEVRLRLLSRAIGRVAHEGEAGLGQIESLLAKTGQAFEARPLRPKSRTGKSAKSLRFKQTLAGAAITLSDDLLCVAPAPRRRPRPSASKP
jgi:tRNA(Ile)-lysidine synthase